MMNKRTEYRVVGENFRGETFRTNTPFRSLDAAIADLKSRAVGGALSGRIQAREIHETPWEDATEKDIPVSRKAPIERPKTKKGQDSVCHSEDNESR